MMTGLTALFPDALLSIPTVASYVFMLRSLLTLISFVCLTQSSGKRLVYENFGVFLLTTLPSIGLMILYPIGTFLLVLLTAIARERRRGPTRREERRNAEDRLIHERAAAPIDDSGTEGSLTAQPPFP